MNKKFLRRTYTAIIFLILVLLSILINKYFFGILFLVFTIISLTEFYLLTEKRGFKPQKLYGTISGALIFIISFLYTDGTIGEKWFLLFIPLFIFLIISELYRKEEQLFRYIAFTTFGIIYIVFPFSFLNYLIINPLTNNEFSHVFILSFFALIWINDTGAYIVGSNFGKHKLFERISPKKTWEGTIGGVLMTIILAFVLSLFFKELTLFQWIIFAVIIAVFGTYGDLSESMLKRRAGVKDSGNILPGHGGLLDRFDSVFLASPIIFVYLKILENYT